eukprot:555239-Prymnesium_polylepis.1
MSARPSWPRRYPTRDAAAATAVTPAAPTEARPTAGWSPDSGPTTSEGFPEVRRPGIAPPPPGIALLRPEVLGPARSPPASLGAHPKHT